MAAPVRVLHLDDNPLDAQLVAMTLEMEQEKFPTTLDYVQTKEEYLDALTRKDFDLILSDYRMPGYDGDQALAAAREICPEIPFIMVTGELGEELVIETLKRGATDYVLKDRIFRLIPAIKRALMDAENARKRDEAEDARERLVEELEKRQAELLAVIQAMQGGVTVFDSEGNIVLVNEAEVKMLGYNDPSELSHNLSHFVDTYEFRDPAGNLIPVEEWPAARIMRGDIVVNCELSGRRKDTGREWFFSFSGEPVRDKSGKQILSVLVARDITERRQAEEELRKAQHATDEILESVQDPFYGLDSQWCFTYVNRKAEEFMEKGREELLGKNLLELFPRVLGTESEHILRAVMESRVPLHREYRSVLKNIWVDVHVFPKADGGLSVLYRDISERKAQEEALRLSEERFAATFRASPYPLALSRVSDGEFFDVNDALLALYGAGREEVIGKTSLELGIWADPKERDRYVEILKREGNLHEVETRIRTRSHGERVVLLSVTLLKADGEQTMLTIVNDITEHKLAEDALLESALFPEENPSPILRISHAGTLLYANRASRPILKQLRFNLGETVPSSLAGPVREAYGAGRTSTFDFALKGSVFSFHVVPIQERHYANLYGRDVTERRRAEQSLREANERYRALFNAIDEGFCIIEVLFDDTGKPIDYRFLDLNPSFEQHTGLINARGRRVLEMVPAYEKQWFEIYGQVAVTGHPVRFQDQAAALHRWYDVFAFPWGEPDDRQVAVLFNDITARRQTEERLKESEELSRLALAAGRAGAWSWDLNTGTLQWSNEFYRVFGIEPGTIEPSAEEGLTRVHPEDRSRVAALIEKVLVSGEAIDETHRVIWPDGSIHWVRGMARAFFGNPSDKKPERLVGLAIDVTTHKETEEKLQKKNRELEAVHFKWQKLIEGIADEVWACDADGRVSMVKLDPKNGTEPIELKDGRLDKLLQEIEVLGPDGSVRPAEASPLQRSLKGEIVRGEETVRNKTTGETRIRLHSSVPVRDVEGMIVGAAAIVRDVTEERRVESETRRMNEELEERVKERTSALERAIKELESFSYSISHDLKAPLRLIGGFADLLVRQGETNLTAKQRDFLATIQTQTAHMEELIKVLLEFSRLTRKEPRLVTVDTRQMVGEVVAEQRQLLGEEASQKVVVEMADLPMVKADPVLLRMVFTNLLSNAFKFTRTVVEPRISIEATRKNDFINFRIKDNGVGFPKGQTEKLFKVFQRLHAPGEFEGSGIGLANVRKIIELHGGQVSGEGEEGKGASFYFALPATTKPG